MENGNGRRIVYGPVLFMTRQYGKLMQLSYDTIAFPGFTVEWKYCGHFMTEILRIAVKNERSTL